MKMIIAMLALLVSAAFAQSSIEATTDAEFRPVKVRLTVTLSPDSVRAAKVFPQQLPAKAIWNWGEHQKVDHLDIAWPSGQLTQSVEHVYTQPGAYMVEVTIVDAKNRFIDQQSAAIQVNEPVALKKTQRP